MGSDFGSLKLTRNCVITSIFVQMVRKISQSQSSYKTKTDIIIDEIMEEGENSDSESDSISEEKSRW